MLWYYPYIFNHAVIYGVRGLEARRHLWRSRVRGKTLFAVIEVERVNIPLLVIVNRKYTLTEVN